MARVLAAFALLVITGMAALADTPRPKTPMDTLRLLQAAALSAGIADKATIDRGRQALILRRGAEEFVSYPDNLHILLRSAGSEAERTAILNEFVAAMKESLPLADTPPQLSRIMPVIRHRDYAKVANGADRTVSLPFAGELRIFLVEDLPQSTPFLIETDLKLLKTTETALLAQAQKNFARLARKAQTEGAADDFRLRILDGNYESSLLLDAAFWNKQLRDHGAVYAAIPARDLLIFYAGKDPNKPREMARMVKGLISRLHHPISTQVMRWDGKRWTPLR